MTRREYDGRHLTWTNSESWRKERFEMPFVCLVPLMYDGSNAGVPRLDPMRAEPGGAAQSIPLALDRPGTYIVCSGRSSGKTKLAVDAVAARFVGSMRAGSVPESFVYCTANRFEAMQTAGRIGARLRDYHGIRGTTIGTHFNYGSDTPIEWRPKTSGWLVVTCPEHLHLVPGRADCVVVDGAETIMSDITSTSACGGTVREPDKAVHNFKNLMRDASVVLVTDVSPNHSVMSIANSYRPKECSVSSWENGFFLRPLEPEPLSLGQFEREMQQVAEEIARIRRKIEKLDKKMVHMAEKLVPRSRGDGSSENERRDAAVTCRATIDRGGADAFVTAVRELAERRGASLGKVDAFVTKARTIAVARSKKADACPCALLVGSTDTLDAAHQVLLKKVPGCAPVAILVSKRTCGTPSVSKVFSRDKSKDAILSYKKVMTFLQDPVAEAARYNIVSLGVPGINICVHGSNRYSRVFVCHDSGDSADMEDASTTMGIIGSCLPEGSVFRNDLKVFVLRKTRSRLVPEGL